MASSASTGSMLLLGRSARGYRGPAAPRDGPSWQHSAMPSASPKLDIEVAGHTVSLSNPDKVFFEARGETKLDLANYYLAVGEGAMRGVRERPTVLKRFPDGAAGSFFF